MASVIQAVFLFVFVLIFVNLSDPHKPICPFKGQPMPEIKIKTSFSLFLMTEKLCNAGHM